MKKVGLTSLILFFFGAPGFIFAQLNFDPLESTPDVNGPIEVEMGYNIINITDIDEKDETIDFDGAIYLRWKDERLSYNEEDTRSSIIDYSKTPEVLYQGAFDVNETFNGWRPFVYIPNGIGNRETSNQTIKIWPDGVAMYSETFHAKVEVPMDLRLYPFDAQDMIIYFHPLFYLRDELILVPSDQLSKKWDQNMGIADWERGQDRMLERPIDLIRYDGTIEQVSEFLVTLKVTRRPLHIIFTLIFPMALLVSLTWIVFWLDKQSVTDRINISFIGILSVVAYYFVIQDGIPEISYFTMIDTFIVETFLILAASVLITLIVGKLDQAGKVQMGDRLDRICRWIFPSSYLLITLIVYFIFVLIA